jgi:hypothetical protein
VLAWAGKKLLMRPGFVRLPSTAGRRRPSVTRFSGPPMTLLLTAYPLSSNPQLPLLLFSKLSHLAQP